MDENKIIEENRDNRNVIFMLDDGRSVIAEVVDPENHLHYVIRNGDDITVEDAWNVKVARIVKPLSNSDSITTVRK